MIPINFLAASKLQAAIECLPRTCADDHNDRYLAGQGEIGMSTFTPGPWHVAAYNDALYITSGRPPASSNDHPLNDSDRTVIAKMFIPDCGSREANARLIADAPAMLDALEDACDFIMAFQYDYNTSVGSDRLRTYQALIAKHRGGK